MAVLDVYKLALLTNQGSVQMVNTFWFRQYNTIPDPNPEAHLANDFVGTLVTPGANSIRASVHQAVQFHTVTVQRYYLPLSASVFTLPITPVQVGMLTGTGMPPVCAACITWVTAKGGRRGRGRFYVPPPGGGDQTNGIWGASHLTRLANMVSTINGRYILLGGKAASGFEMGVWSRVDAGVPPVFNPTAFSLITGWTVRTNVRALTRRTAP